MKFKTAELDGESLNIAVALADGWEVWDRLHDKRAIFDKSKDRTARAIYLTNGKQDERWPQFNPATSWAEGGPIIERERITVQASQAGDWRAFLGDGTKNAGTGRAHADSMIQTRGETPLTAAMRAFVTAKLGEEVELP